MYAMLLGLMVATQAPVDYDFVDLGKKIDALGLSVERAGRRLALIEDKVNTLLDRFDSKASGELPEIVDEPPVPSAPVSPVYPAQPSPVVTYTPVASPGYVVGAVPVYTGGTIVRRGFFRSRGYRQMYVGSACQ